MLLPITPLSPVLRGGVINYSLETCFRLVLFGKPKKDLKHLHYIRTFAYLKAVYKVDASYFIAPTYKKHSHGALLTWGITHNQGDL